MSGVAGGDRISREHIDSTAKSYIDTVLSRFPGFQSAEVTGSVAAGKKDFGDIDRAANDSNREHGTCSDSHGGIS